MALDAFTIFGAAMVAMLAELHERPVAGLGEAWRGALVPGRSLWVLLVLLCGYAFTLILTSQRLNLYTPKLLNGILNEQWLSVQACLTSGILLAGALYLVPTAGIPRGIVLLTTGLVTLIVSLRRLVSRLLLYRGFARGIGLRNVLIVGTGEEANALRSHLDRNPRLGYAFKGFIGSPGSESYTAVAPGDVAGAFDMLFHRARKLFVDEILLAAPLDRETLQSLMEKARLHHVDLRAVPNVYADLAGNSPIEFVGPLRTILLHRGRGLAASLKSFRHSAIWLCSLRSLQARLRRFGLLLLGAPRQEQPRLPVPEVPYDVLRHGQVRCNDEAAK